MRARRALFYGDGYATGQDRLWEAVQSGLASRIWGGATRLRTLVQRLPGRRGLPVTEEGWADGYR